MAKIKLTKTELKAQTDALKRFQRFLPMLQLKKQQLQGEIAGITAKAEESRAKERAVRESLDSWVGLFATDESLLSGLVSVKSVKTGTANIAGVAIPTFESRRGSTTPSRRRRRYFPSSAKGRSTRSSAVSWRRS